MQATTVEPIATAREAEASHARSAWRAWLWVPALMFISLHWNITANLPLSADMLLVPLAAFIGHRHGKKGIVIVALGALLTVVDWWFASLSAGGLIDVYLTAVCVSALAASSRALSASLPDWVDVRRLIPALLVLPIYLSVYGATLHGIEIQLSGTLELLLYLFVFALGLRAANTRAVMAALAMFAALGMLLDAFALPDDARDLLGGPRAELPLIGLTELRFIRWEYLFDSPAALLMATAYFQLGRLCAFLYSHKGISWSRVRSYALTIALCVLALGWQLNAYFASASPDAEIPSRFHLIGHYYALPCAALTAALLLRYAGVAVVLAMVAFFWILDGVIRAGFDWSGPRIIFAIHEPITVLSFGALGLALRNRLLGTSDVWWSPRWASYAVVLSVSVPMLFSWDSLWDFLWASLTFAAGLVLGHLATKFRKKYLGWLPKHGGWVAMFSVLALALVIWAARSTIVQMLSITWGWMIDARESVGAGDGWGTLNFEETLPTFALLIGSAAWLSTLSVLIRRLPDCWRDLQALWRVARRRAGSPAQAAPAEEHRWNEYTAWIISSLRTVVTVAAVMLLVAQVILDLYPSQGLRAVVGDWFGSRTVTDVSGPTTEPAPTQPSTAESNVNPYLLQAAREHLALAKISDLDPAARSIRTDWQQRPRESNVRRQTQVTIGRELAPSALNVSVLRQDRRFGVWVEQGTYWKSSARAFAGRSTFEEEQQLHEKIYARAVELANAVPAP